jgi:hypothetical protein
VVCACKEAAKSHPTRTAELRNVRMLDRMQ